MQPPSRFTNLKHKAIVTTLRILIHYFPILCDLFSMRLTDIRIVFEELEGLEVTVEEVRLGAKVEFEKGDATTGTWASDFDRNNPLLSPSLSPSPCQITFGSIPEQNCPRASRVARARRRASLFQSRVSSTASFIWSRATARDQGVVTATVSLGKIGIILPTSPSLSEPIHGDVPQSSSRPRSLASVGSLHSLFNGKPAKNANHGRGYQQLLSIDEPTNFVYSLRFGPHKGLLGEDTLHTSLDIGKLQTDLLSLLNLQELMERRKSSKPSIKSPGETWSPQSWPRVSLDVLDPS